MKKAVMLWVVVCLLTVVAVGSVEANNCKGLVGGWYSGTPNGKGTSTIKFYPSGQISVWLPGRGNYTGSCTGNGSFVINFTDDPGCCTGNSGDGGRTIHWSDGTKCYRAKN